MTVMAAALIRVLCVEDHPIMRDGIGLAIQAQKDMELVGEAGDGAQAIAAFRRLKPDITLLDLQLPDMNGTAVIQAIRQDFPTARIIVLTTYSGDVQAARALKAGAAGYLLKSMLRTELVNTIRIVNTGGRRVSPEVAAEMAQHFDADELSPREIDVLRSVAGGNSNKIVADVLGITEDTVKGHMKNILMKLGANDRTHAVSIAMKRGYL